MGWSGLCNTDRVACGPVCGVGVEWVLQHRPCYVWSCLWGWGGVGFATQTMLRVVLSVGLGWGGVGFATQTMLRVVLSVGWGRVGFATQTVLRVVLSVGLGWSGFCNPDHVMCGPVCEDGVGWDVV